MQRIALWSVGAGTIVVLALFSNLFAGPFRQSSVALAEEPGSPLFGFNDAWQSPTGYRHVDYASDLDADVIRFGLSWARTNPEPGVWRWQNSDRLYDAAVEVGLRPLVIVEQAPCWARPSSFGGGRCPMNGGWRPDPQYLDEYRGFVAQVVERYPEIVAVEAGNEPNLTPWWLPKPEPEYYTRYLKATYQGVKSIRPELPVLFGGLSPLVRDPAGPETGMSWQTFLERAYGAGAKQWFDGLGYHSYIISDQYASKLRLRMEWIDTLTRKHGDAGVPVWITETGYGTRGSGAVSEQQQATRLRTTHQIFSSYDRVEAVIFNRMFDIGDDYYGSTGLVTLNGALKASYCLLAIWRQTSPGRCS